MVRVLVFVSDQHAGSTVGLMAQPVQIEDGQWIHPSKIQRWLWAKHLEFVDDVREIIDEVRPESTHLFSVGDAVDGYHHKTVGVIHHDEAVHIAAAVDVFEEGLLRIPFDTVHLLRGTPSHVRQNAALEQGVANRLVTHGHPIVKDEENSSNVWRYLYAEFDGLLLDVRHHGKMGQLERTLKSYSGLYATEVWMTHVLSRRTPPDLAVRGHRHRAMDSGLDPRKMTRVLNLPCWQLTTEWAASRAFESLPDIGGCVVVLRDGRPTVRWLLYEPEPDKQRIWTYEAD